MRTFLLLLVPTLFFACDGGVGKKPERNVIKEYVNTPKDKARGAASALEDAQNKTHEQFKDLVEDE